MAVKNPTSATLSRSKLRRRINEVQANWSVTERQRRYQDVHKRLMKFAALVAPYQVEPRILAVGAVAFEDCGRITG